MSLKIPTIPMDDVLMHGKPGESSDVVVFPYTRYKNISGAPNVVTYNSVSIAAPFQLLKTDTVDVSVESIRSLCGDIL